MIDMVNKEALRHGDDFAVHRYGQPLPQDRRPLAPYGIACTAPLAGVPFVSDEPFVIVGVHNGVSSLREGDSAERVAVTQFPVPEHRQHGRPFQPGRNSDSDGKLGDFAPTPRCAECRILNYEFRIMTFVDSPVRV